jgi:hypothetical protein
VKIRKRIIKIAMAEEKFKRLFEKISLLKILPSNLLLKQWKIYDEWRLYEN